MRTEDILAGMPAEGFLKTTKPAGKVSITPKERAKLVRMGNELFNAGEVERAKRIFLTVGYSDGLIRVGDWYWERREPLEAFKMYREAPAPERVGEIIQGMAQVIKQWINE